MIKSTAAFVSETFFIYNNPEFNNLKKLYSTLDKYINCLSNAEIHLDGGHSFSNFCGDLANGIKWTWVMNSIGISYFDNFLKSINFYKNIEPRLGKFHIRGGNDKTTPPYGKTIIRRHTEQRNEEMTKQQTQNTIQGRHKS